MQKRPIKCKETCKRCEKRPEKEICRTKRNLIDEKRPAKDTKRDLYKETWSEECELEEEEDDDSASAAVYRTFSMCCVGSVLQCVAIDLHVYVYIYMESASDAVYRMSPVCVGSVL